jgi:adenine-specific DNA-methyltransferase
MNKFNDLIKKLKEIFQIDRPELDFGVYRILNARAAEIDEYLNVRLKEKVMERLSGAGRERLELLGSELKEKEAAYIKDGLDPDSVPKIQELKAEIKNLAIGDSEHENAVYSHLLTFFSRYYDKGDFISQRRYKGDTYAIPYSGEEVVLHWANKDQYYTKSSENFSNYAFKLDDGRTVRFRLIAADTAKDNRKDNDKDRNFILAEATTITRIDEEGEEYEEEIIPIEASSEELVIRFEYKVTPGKKQADLVLEAVTKILQDETVKKSWLELTSPAPTEKNPARTVLEKCLTNYTSKNKADYFIHKNLKKFLTHELDFYIKNEVMHLDDLQHLDSIKGIERNLRMIQTLRSIAQELIDFLSQLEDFQKKLWLKKKFVVDTEYCFTLDRIPESFYEKIAQNKRQWDEWERLGMLSSSGEGDLFSQGEIGTVEYLRTHQYLMVDTGLYAKEFKDEVLGSIHDLDEQIDGVLVHGDNFQGLGLLQERYREQVKCVYIDPPYNTGSDGFIYKDNFQHSSWLALLLNRYEISKTLMQSACAIFTNIDDQEGHYLKIIKDYIFNRDNFIRNIVWQKRTSPDMRAIIGDGHDHILLFAKDKNFFEKEINRIPKSEEQRTLYKNPDNDPNGPWVSSDYTAQGFRPNQMYKITTPSGKEYFPPEGRCWKNIEKVFNELRENNQIWFGQDGSSVPRRKTYLSQSEDNAVWSWWTNKEVGHNQEAKKESISFLGVLNSFETPKPLRLLKRIIYIASNPSSLILDYFAGSGTTAHAVINLNREDNGKRKYILMEQGEYFDTVLKPRIQKVVYANDWKEGKPKNHNTGISHAFKVLKIESYEDTLNNLELRRTEEQLKLLGNRPELKDEYLMHYMLEVESRGSLLSVEDFSKPFDYSLKVSTDSAGAYEMKKVDLIETFNYLIGLRVDSIDVDRKRGFALVKGYLPSGEHTLVIWRDTELVSYDELERICSKESINPKDSEFEVVYINGDHTIPSIFVSDDSEGGIEKRLKVRQIEPEFLSLMFQVEDIS